MKKLALALFATTAVIGVGGLAACADDYGVHAGYYYGDNDAYVDAYYDDFYGPYTDGYWGNDGYFYYSTGPGHAFARDTDRHFRRDTSTGFHAVRAHSHAPMRR
ncbi:MAG TPA: hypothetical protein VG407_10910 [Caulobacteraceae bacterium]|jgi:hypothetical protein|nr:hypothetical protein [Caulobacteraceae bacterium]